MTETGYPPLPTIDPQRPDEPVFYYGARVLRFVIATGITATLADTDLEAALHSSIAAVTLPPAQEDDPPVLVAVHDAIAVAKRLIAAALYGRARDAQEAQSAAQATQPSHPPKGAPGTSAVPLAPLPKVNPPAGQYAERVPVARPEVTF